MAVAGKKKSVSEILVEYKVVTPEQLAEAEADAKKSGEPVQQALVDSGKASASSVLAALAREWKVKAADLTQLEIDQDAARIIPKQMAKRYQAIPFAKAEGMLLVAMVDPRDVFAVEDIQLRFGMQVTPYLSLPSNIRAAISKVHGVEEAASVTDEDEDAEVDDGKPKQSQSELADEAKELTSELLAGLEAAGADLKVDKMGEEETSDIMQVDTSAPEVEKLVNAIILEAIRLKASDIHVEPQEKRLQVRYRVDGALRRSTFKIPMTFKQALIAKIKIMSDMNITERRIPQDGRISVKAKGKPIEFRVNIVPSVYGESAVMRLLDRSGAVLTLDQLGFLPDTQEKFMKALGCPYGLVLVCGPTGSGKSFTLMASLAAVRDPEEKILTAENPVEYNLEGVIQVPVNPDLKMGPDKCFDFVTALRAFLRQDPDTIMIGEIRDKETGQIALEAAMTGHLVLSTIHTNNASLAVSRLFEMGIASYLIASTMEAVLAQRLIRTLCKACKEPDPNPPPEVRQALDEAKIDYSKANFMKAKGCPKCGNRGLKGRTAIHELLVMDDDLRKQAVTDPTAAPIEKIAREHGMRTLVEDGLVKVTMGLTTIGEVLASAKG